MRRVGARTKNAIPPSVLRKLNIGVEESVNLMEWLAVDMDQLAHRVLKHQKVRPVGREILRQLPPLAPLGVTKRLETIGRTIGRSVESPSHAVIRFLSTHGSDIVRQWAVYAINSFTDLPLLLRLRLVRRFAADPNMTVRECAWMALRPAVARELNSALILLQDWTLDIDPNIRRTAIEVTRPRSVWGRHIVTLKDEPSLALPLLQAVRADTSMYVRTAVANWLNDAYKSQPTWVENLCKEWSANSAKETSWIIRRALRSKVSD